MKNNVEFEIVKVAAEEACLELLEKYRWDFVATTLCMTLLREQEEHNLPLDQIVAGLLEKNPHRAKEWKTKPID